MMKRNLAITTIGGMLLASAAIAQTPAPSATPAPTMPAPATETVKPPPHNLAVPGKWRASKLVGVDIYGPDNKKVGDVTEIVLDKSGKIEMITVGVGGFLGIGSKDVAIPFEQVTWSEMPMATASAPPANTPATGAAPAPATAMPKAPQMYPDHGKISMTKEQLTNAPAVTYSASN